jgi:HD-GYP domain-containing protein (c-di-GMP phosphodiesterase class II)
MEKKNLIYNELIAALSLALDVEENGKLYHAWRTGVVSWAIADRMSLPNKNYLFYAGLLHDIGAIGLDDHIVHQIISKNCKYKDQILAHSKRGSEFVQLIPGLEVVREYILDHHENWDGSGYPNRKKGDKISIGGQIIHIADIFDIKIRTFREAGREQIIDQMYKEVNQIYSGEIFTVFEQTVTTDFFEIVKDIASLEEMVKEMLTNLTLPIQVNQDATAAALASIIDTKHKYTSGHSQRVALYSVALANVMELPLDSVERVLTAGLLHDLGKVAVPSKILDKPDRLTKKEFDIVKKHPGYTKEILETVSVLKPIASIAGGHHERIDGLGYPLGLKGDELPLEAKILIVADAFDAMTSLRPYQRLLTPEEALKEIKAKVNTQFDKNIIDVSECLLKSVDYIRNDQYDIQLLYG